MTQAHYAQDRRYYTPSGRVSLAAPVKVLVYGAPISALLALIYSVVIHYNPLVYLSFIATLVFGACLGLAASFASGRGLSRSRPFNAFAGVVVALIGLWLHWMIWAWLTYGDGLETARQLAASGPRGWLDFFSFTAEHRQLSVGRLGRAHADMSADLMCWVWGLEAFLVVMVSVFVSLAGDTPFSEKTKTWSKTDGEREIPAPGADAPDAEEVERRMDREGVDWLLALANTDRPGAQDGPGTRLRLTCTSVPDDAECRFLSVSAITRKGEKNRKEVRSLVTYRYLDPAAYSKLLECVRQPKASA